MAEEEPSYIDYEAFLDPNFSPISFANKLVLATNETSDASQDLSTPLSKVLFDVQEIDTHLDRLTTKSAIPLLQYTHNRSQASQRILDEVQDQIANLTTAYNVLKREVIERHETADQVKLVAERLFAAVRLARGVSRSLMLGRQLELQVSDLNTARSKATIDHQGMLRSANTIAAFKTLLAASSPHQEGFGLERIQVITTLRTGLVYPVETLLLGRAQQIIREFSLSSLLSSNIGVQPTATAPTYTQNQETKSRTISALLSLYLLTPIKPGTPAAPALVISTLQEYIQAALKSSLAALSRSLATLPTLDRTLLEISARCQNILALETLLSSTVPPPHPHSEKTEFEDFLGPLLQSLDTNALPSFFWRTLASALSPKVNEILTKGGVSARQLRSNKDRIRESIRNCVDRGSQLPEFLGKQAKDKRMRSWEREAAVMIASVVGPLNR